MNIKFTCAFSARGAAVPVFATVSGLNKNKLIISEEELSNYKGRYVMCIRGLSAHSATDQLKN